MNLLLERADDFNTDFNLQYRWYLNRGGEELAEHFLRAVAITLPLLAKEPDIGIRRKFQHPILLDLRSYPVTRPFQKFLIFYRVKGNVLQAWRLMHGARDLSRRLAEPPGA
jgi:plasmid stabilization system protein ParE